jgi:hypothetical protein
MTLFLLPAGCQQVDRFTGEYVYNYTSTPVSIFYVHNGETLPMSEPIPVGGSATLNGFSGGCSDGTLLARDASGSVVAKRDAPLCTGDTWNVGTPPSHSP